MALYNYITTADVTNKIFNGFQEDTRQGYMDLANDHIEDLGILKGVKPENINTPIHSVIKRYAINWALSIFAEDMIGFANTGPTVQSQGDRYEQLFKRCRYLVQELRLELVEVMFTGEEETPMNRAITSTRIYRG